MKNTLIVGLDKFPNGDAGALRLECFAKMLINAGHNVVVAGLGESTNFEYKNINDIKYISLRHPKTSFFNRVINILFFKQRLKKLVINKMEKFDYVILGWVNNKSVVNYFKKYAKRNNAQLVFDCVEWFSKEQFKNGSLARTYYNNNKMNTVWIDKISKVISISKYLQNHFESRGVNSLRVPVVLDVDNVSFNKNTVDNKIVVSYAGMPGKKDYFTEILQALTLLSDEQLNCIELRIMGATFTNLTETISLEQTEWQKISKSINCLGRISRNEVLKQLSESDFTILMRSNQLRYAKAGFPTKVVESLSSGTPVICNLTSDLGDYLIDGYNSYIVNNVNKQEIFEVFNKVLNVNLSKRKELYLNARNTAEKYFNYKNYENSVINFIESKN